MGLTQFMNSMIGLQIAPISSQIAQAFGWTDDNKNLFLGATQTAPLVANALANFLGYLLGKYSPNKIVYFSRLIFLVFMSLTLVANTYLLIFSRFIMGICLGF